QRLLHMVTMEEDGHSSGVEASSVLCDNTTLVSGRPEERSVAPIATLPTTYSHPRTYLKCSSKNLKFFNPQNQ
ncbi:unnamed protein product, partial [Sphagnum balticum]